MSEGILQLERDTGSARPRGLQRLARRAVIRRLERIGRGQLTLVDPERVLRFGGGDGPTARVFVRDPGFYLRLLLRGSVGAGEAYMDGDWDTDDLTDAVRVLAANRDALARLDGGWARLARPGLRALHGLRRNTRRGAQRNVAAHYDLGNAFFGLFLDPTWTYSSAIFEREGMGLEEAQRAKYDRVCRKLRLGPGDRVLEIGGGWGGFALHAAGRYGCRVTTTTVSAEQFALARKRVAAAGLAGRVEVLFRDYRSLEGVYDRLVSIEMVEAVGARNLATYFRVCSERLASHGSMLLQAITVPEQDYATSVRSVDFVKRHIFPGGQLVSLGAIANALARATDLRITHVEDFTPHYATTLAHWRARLAANLDRARALGLDERFLRMWEFYLCYCEGGFAERVNGVQQIVLEKPAARREPLLGALEGA